MFRGVHSNAICKCLSGQVRAVRLGWVFSRFSFHHGCYEKSTGSSLSDFSGVRTARRKKVAASERVPAGTLVRCHSLRTVSRAGGRIFLVIPRTFYFIPLFNMDAKKKNNPPEKGAAKTANSPVKTFLLDDVSASVFAREHETKNGMQTFYSVSFSRSYRDSNGKRMYVKTFNLEDLGKLVTTAQQADEYIRKLLQSAVA